MLVGVGVAAALVTGGLVLALLVGDGGAGDSSSAERAPTELSERWAATLEGPVSALKGTEDMIVALTGTEPMLVGFDVESGAQRWRAPAPRGYLASMDVIDQVVVLRYLHSDGGSVAAFDVTSGRALWSKALMRGREPFVAGEPVMRGFDRNVVAHVDLFDPMTGASRGSIDGDEVSFSSTSIHAQADGVIELFDRRTFEIQGRVDLAELGVDQFRATAASTDAGLVVATFERAMLLDDEGEVVSAVAFSTRLDAPWVLDELDGSGRFLLLQGQTRAMVLTVRDGTLVELWTRRARVVDWFLDDSHQILVVQSNDQNMESRLELVDATSGDSIWTGRELVFPADSSPIVRGGNGFIAGAEDDPFTLVAYSLDGSSLWRLPVGDRDWITMVGAALVTVDRTAPSRATLTLLS